MRVCRRPRSKRLVVRAHGEHGRQRHRLVFRPALTAGRTMNNSMALTAQLVARCERIEEVEVDA